MEYDDIKSEFQLQQPLQEESMKVDPNNAASFNKQNSILSLTLDEIQLKSGKSFGSMNMDEFLANLWNVDENQVPPQPAQNEPTNYANGVANQAAILQQQQQQQASLSVPATLCKKTVDEVWFEIQKEHNPNNVCRVRGPPQRAQTYGEMTLEEFLVQAGIVQCAPPMSSQRGMVAAIQNNNKNTTACLDANFQMGHVMGIGFSAHPSLNGFVTYQTFSQNNTLGGESSNNGANENFHHNLVDSNGQKNKRRIIDGPPEIVVERRQRRMIKNRESAARSRARKQAYTVELELELNLLKEENAKLKQVVEEIEQKRKLEVMNKKKTTMAQKKATKLRTMRRSLSLSL